jgi:hypothetical protein
MEDYFLLLLLGTSSDYMNLSYEFFNYKQGGNK